MSMYSFIQVVFMSPEYDECIKLRNEILRIPLNLEFDTDQLEKEYNHYHFGLYDSELNLLGCLVFEKKSEEVLKMRQVAICTPFQNKGLGKILVKRSEQWALERNFKLIELHARDLAVPFYNSLGYQCEGEPFVEVSIKHYQMHKKLSSAYEKN